MVIVSYQFTKLKKTSSSSVNAFSTWRCLFRTKQSKIESPVCCRHTFEKKNIKAYSICYVNNKRERIISSNKFTRTITTKFKPKKPTITIATYTSFVFYRFN